MLKAISPPLAGGDDYSYCVMDPAFNAGACEQAQRLSVSPDHDQTQAL